MKVEIGNAILYLGDCAAVLPDCDSTAALVSDPPYGIKTDTARSRRSKRVSKGGMPVNWEPYKPVAGDDRPFDPAPLLRFQQVILWGANHYCDRLPGSPHWLIWDKREGTTPDDNADCEIAWSNLRGPARVFRHLWRGLCRKGEENIAAGRDAWRLHPTQKPIALMSWCIEQAKMPDTVIDPYMGSGSTGVAAVRLGKRFIGMEIDEGYFCIACKRIEQAQKQTRLFA